MPRTLIVYCALALMSFTARAWDFSYGYQTVYSPNADTYIVDQQNVTKISEWQSPPITYWGPSGNGVQGVLTSRFDFSAPTTEVFLNASLTSFNWIGGAGSGYGSSSLWGSTDGSSWQLLLDDPTPPNGTGGVAMTYSQDVPASLLGGTSFWLQVRMQEASDYSIAADGQFGRADGSAPGNIFELDAMLAPEPSSLGLGLLGASMALAGVLRRKRH